MSTLYVKAYTLLNYDVPASNFLWELHFFSPDTIYVPTPIIYNIAQGAQNPSATPLPTFPNVDAAVAYYAPAASALLIADVNAAYGVTIFNTYEVEMIDSTVMDKFNALATVAKTGSYNDLLNKPTITGGSRTQSALSLSLVGTGATGTQIDATYDALINVTVGTSATASIAGSGTSSVALKICATNNATEASWTTVATSETSQSYALAVAISGVTGMKEQLSALVPAGWYVKLVNSGSGTHSESFISGQKVIFS